MFIEVHFGVAFKKVRNKVEVFGGKVDLIKNFHTRSGHGLNPDTT